MRLAGVAKAGFFALRVEVVSSIAALVQLQPGKGHFVCDPCAGAGEAIDLLIRQWKSSVRGLNDTKVIPLLCEVEKNRYDLILARTKDQDSALFGIAEHHHKSHFIHGDAFKVGWKEGFEGVSILWLNPPYDSDSDAFKVDKDEVRKEAKRWEEEFLRHYHHLLSIGGALLFFVPYHALKASASTLAQHFEDIACYKMPEPIFTSYYRQVVLVARKRPALHQPDPLWQAVIEGWASDPESIPVLPLNGEGVDPLVVESDHETGWLRVESAGWMPLAFDVSGVIRTAKLWHTPTRAGELRPIETVIPSAPFNRLCSRTYPLAMPPRATHIGAAISAGVMSGVRLVPNDREESRHLPVLYIGGHFEKAFKTVEERTNAEGELSSYVQVEQPVLRITVLDTRTATYITLKNEVAESDAKDLTEFTAGDLLRHYGDSMVAELKKRCPPLYDPSDPNENMFPIVWPEDRTPFEAQEHSIRALVKLLQQGPDHSAIFIGSLGSGKSNVSLMVGQTVFDTSRRIGADHILVLAPPHLGSTWKSQVAATWPEARAIMLETLADMDDFARHQIGWAFSSARPGGSKLDGHSGPVVGVLSRETAKLGHRYVGISNGPRKAKGEAANDTAEKDDKQAGATGYCSRCGTPTYELPDDLAKKRARCEAKFKKPSNAWAEWVRRIALTLVPIEAHTAEVAEKLTLRGERLYVERRMDLAAKRHKAGQPRNTPEELQRVREGLGRIAVEMAPSMPHIFAHVYCKAKDPHPSRAWVRLLIGCNDDAMKLRAIQAYVDRAMTTTDDYGRKNHVTHARNLLALLRSDAMYQEGVKYIKAAADRCNMAETYGDNTLTTVQSVRERLWGKPPFEGEAPWFSIGQERFEFSKDGKVTVGGHALASSGLSVSAIRELSGVATYVEDTKACGEPLYQAYARPLGKGTMTDDECDKAAPRRVPLAYYFSKRLRKFLRRGKWMIITDEVHELSNNEDSAQSKAAQQLWNLRLPTIAMTGSIMNGYPSSLFILLWSLSSDFRKEFGRHEGARYAKTYGYQKQIVVVEDGRKKVKEFGAFSDKTEEKGKQAKNAGFSPGMLPASTLRHTLRKAVTLQLRDIAKSLPPCHFKVEKIAPSAEQGAKAMALFRRLNEQIKRDRFTKDMGKLMGALTEAPSFLDRCIQGVGNQEDGSWSSEYPDGRGVWSFEGFDPAARLPKEKWLLDYLDNQFSQGRDAIVLSWHLNLLPRLREIIEKDLKVIAPILYSDKVAPKNRETWIQKELDGRGAKVFLVNPVSISTGLNALIRFSSIVWFENCLNAYTFRQANGRIIRIGQKRETEIVSALYSSEENRSNVQVLMHRLLMHKVGVSEGIEGLDPAAALQAAGVGDQDALAGRDIGRLISSMLDGDESSLRLLQREFIDRLSSKTDEATAMGGVV